LDYSIKSNPLRFPNLSDLFTFAHGISFYWCCSHKGYRLILLSTQENNVSAFLGVESRVHRSKEDGVSESTITLLVGASISLVSSLLVLIVSNYLQRKSDERRRIWELQDRKNARIREAREKKIASVNDCIETYHSVFNVITKFEVALIRGDEDLALYKENFDMAVKTTNFPFEKTKNIITLNNITIRDLDAKVSQFLYEERRHAEDLYNLRQGNQMMDSTKEQERLTESIKVFSNLLAEMALNVEVLSPEYE
jgi:hypothetical protein